MPIAARRAETVDPIERVEERRIKGVDDRRAAERHCTIAVTVPMKMRPKPAQAQRVLISGCWGDDSGGAARPHLTPEQATRGNRAIRQCPTRVMAHAREREGSALV